MEFFSLIWNEILIKPMINALVSLYVLLFDNFGLSIIVFTFFIRFITLPLTKKQLNATKKMSTLGPTISALKNKYSNDKAKISQETMRIYKQEGVNPVGCLGPMLIQLPIWIALYQAIMQILPSTPDAITKLSDKLYYWAAFVHGAVPLDSTFLFWDLAIPDSTPVLPLLVGVSMWVQQKMTIVPTTDPKQSQTNTMMLWMMPIMFMFFTFSFPSGLALYWTVSNLVGIVTQYLISGWGGLLPKPKKEAEKSLNVEKSQDGDVTIKSDEEKNDDGERRSDGENSRRSNRNQPKATGRKAKRGRDRGRKQR
jgi:YidC/Oxa1 family membrane protein insertase